MDKRIILFKKDSVDSHYNSVGILVPELKPSNILSVELFKGTRYGWPITAISYKINWTSIESGLYWCVGGDILDITEHPEKDTLITIFKGEDDDSKKYMSEVLKLEANDKNNK